MVCRSATGVPFRLSRGGAGTRYRRTGASGLPVPSGAMAADRAPNNAGLDQPAMYGSVGTAQLGGDGMDAVAVVVALNPDTLFILGCLAEAGARDHYCCPPVEVDGEVTCYRRGGTEPGRYVIPQAGSVLMVEPSGLTQA